MKHLIIMILIFISSFTSTFLIKNLKNSHGHISPKINQKIAQNSDDVEDNLDINNQNNPLIFVPQAKEDAPGRRKKGGSYGELNQCSSNNLLLTALVYGEKITNQNGTKEDKYLLNHTAQEKPNFWFYLKDTKANNQSKISIEFKLLNQENELIYQKRESVKSNVGILGISLGKEALPLRINQKYYWSFTLLCDLEDNSKNPYVYGTIERIKLDKNFSATMNLNTEAKIKFYAENGLWNETISTIMNDLYPKNKEKALSWLNQLLNSVQLNGAILTIKQ